MTVEAKKETLGFQTEVKHLLHLMIHMQLHLRLVHYNISHHLWLKLEGPLRKRN